MLMHKENVMIVRSVSIVAVFAAALALLGCEKQETKTQPPTQGTPAPATTKPAVTPLVAPVQLADWCKEHVVPESVCTRCNESLIPEFKKKGDWCDTHNLPKTQCLTCSPELKAKFEAMAPKN
jgi:cobalt-zinc-cadmium efflux system membrane fusion protein